MDAAETHPAYKTGVLQKAHHERLVANIDGYAKDAGIQPFWIWTTLIGTVSQTELDYFRDYRKHKVEGVVHGLCYHRVTQAGDPLRHMNALAGALVRNFIRARVMTLGTVLDTLAKGDEVVATCLLIPNFHLSKKDGGQIAPWQITHLHDLLVQRGQAGLQTVVYTSDLEMLRKDYGLEIGRIIENNFIACPL